MDLSTLDHLISELINGTITPAEHERLQEELRQNPQARTLFRERMDLETSLRSWAMDGAIPIEESAQPKSKARWRTGIILAASIAVMLCSAWLLWEGQRPARDNPSSEIYVGTIRKQQGSVWAASPTSGNRFLAEPLSLKQGTAELEFDSGAKVILQGPSELHVISKNRAKLLSGNAVVKATEIVDTFTLQTPEAFIIDEEAEYAVSITDEETEVHVFEGLARWEPQSHPDQSETIQKGEARRYSRANPTLGFRVPFGQRKFVREIEQQIRDQAGDALLAYDGFENLAGRLRRGRSGFGWNGGWTNARRGRGKIGNIIDAPDDIVFGMKRSGRRQLQMSERESIRRELTTPISMQSEHSYFVSFLLQWNPQKPSSRRFFELSLIGSNDEIVFGTTSKGFPFIKFGDRVTQTAAPIEAERVYLCVAKIHPTENGHIDTAFRVYHPNEEIESVEPVIWTTSAKHIPCTLLIDAINLRVGFETSFNLDELRVGTTWQAVTTEAKKGKFAE